MTSEPLADRWTGHDFPVLLENARRVDAGDAVIDSRAIAQALGLDELRVARATDALAEAGYLVGKGHRAAGHGVIIFLTNDLTERGRRAVGLWPSGDVADTLVVSLEHAVEATDDVEEKGRLRQAIAALGGVSRDLLVDITAGVIARQSGLG